MARPVSLGLDVSFLARHTQDVGLIESLYQNSAENALSEDTLLQIASYIVYMDHTNNDYLPSASSSGNTLARVPDAGITTLVNMYTDGQDNRSIFRRFTVYSVTAFLSHNSW